MIKINKNHIKVWNCKTDEYEEIPEEMFNFLIEIIELCKKYDLSISHEDTHGAFEITKYEEYYSKWLFNAHKDY